MAVYNSDEITDQHLFAVIDSQLESMSRLGVDNGQPPMLSRGLVYSSLNSINTMLRIGIKQVVTDLFRIEARFTKSEKRSDEERDIETYTFVVKFDDVEIGKPVYTPSGNNKPRPLYPYICRTYHLDYSAPMKLWATITARAYKNNGAETASREFKVAAHPVGNIPICVGSENCNLYDQNANARANIEKEDPNDPGGYYIIGGQEWVISMIENAIYNQPRIYRNIGHEKEIARCEIISKPGEAYEHSYETVIVFHEDGNITVELRSHSDLRDIQFPFYIIFRMLGMNFDKEIFDNIVYGYSDPSKGITDNVSDSMCAGLTKAFDAPTKHFQHVKNIVDQAELIREVAKIVNGIIQSKRTNLSDQDRANDDTTESLIMHMLKNLDRCLLPHVGTSPESRTEKLRFLGHLIHKTFLVSMQIANPTDRDSLAEKRIHAPGHAFIKIFKKVFNNAVVKKIRNRLTADLKSSPFSQVSLDLSFKNALQGRELERMLTDAIIAGKKDKPTRGSNQASRLTSELMVRKNNLNFLSTCRVIRTNSSAATKMAQRGEEMRQAHPSYPGYIDMIQSADTGEQVGMVRQLCLGAFICESNSSKLMRDILLEDPDIRKLSEIWPSDMAQSRLTKVLVNGSWIGCTSFAPRVHRRYVEARRGYEPVTKMQALSQTGPTAKIPFLQTPAVTKRDEKTSQVKLVKQAEYIEFKHRGKHLIDPLNTLYWDTDSDELHFWTENSRVMKLALVVRNNGELDPVGRQLFAERGIKPHNPYAPPEKSGFVQDVVITRDDIRKLYRKEISVPQLILEGKLEYIAPEECKKSVLAGGMNVVRRHRHDPLRPYTHCEIPAALLGLPALTCPFANCNQTPRIIFQTNQSKQTCGIPFKNYPYRADKHTFMQYEVHAPLVPTLANKYLYPNGMNTIVAIDAIDGYNQEDSLIANKSSSERGMFGGEHYNFTKCVLSKTEKFGRPDRTNTKNMKDGIDYSILQEDGFPKRGTILKQPCPVIGVREAETQRPNQPRTYIDKTVPFKYTEKSMVINTVVGKDRDGLEFGKVVFSAHRPWGIGEKFSSRHGQKGMTGIVRTQADMIFSKNGITPNMILSPHAIPSRMTIAQLIESNASKMGAMHGTFTDGTIFTPIDMDTIGDELHKLGFDRYGTEVMYNGMTGDRIDMEIFIGPTFYQRLQKFVVDELYSISTGPTCVLTRQPVEGRAHGGALRIGEMEQAVIIAHGSGHFLLEKFRDDSDGYEMYVCRTCRNKNPVVNEMKNIVRCQVCDYYGTVPDILKVKTTWASKLFLQELDAMNAGTLLGIEPHEYETLQSVKEREQRNQVTPMEIEVA